MKIVWSAILALTMPFLVSLPIFAQESMVHQPISLSEDAVEHHEIMVPPKLLPDLPLLNQKLSMQDAIDIGLKNNLGIHVSQSETGVQRAMLREAKAEKWPVFSLGSLSFLKAGNSETLMTPDMMMNTVDSTLFQDLNATGRMPLFTGGRIKGNIQAARFALGGSEAKLDQQIVETAYDIRTAYLESIFTQSEHLIHQQHIALEQSLLQNAEARYRVGSGLKADILRVKTELADARRMLNDEHAKLNDALFDLKATMGTDLASNISLLDSLTFNPWQGPDLTHLVGSALAKNPKVIEAEQHIQEAKAQVRVARSEYWPQVYGQVTDNLRFPARSPMMGNGVIGMVTAKLPVYSRIRGAEIAKAQATLLKTQQEAKVIQLNIAKDLAKMWSELHFVQENVYLAEASVKQAEEDLRLIQRRHAVGRAILVEVHDTALALRQAQLNQIESVYNHELAKARLIRAVGTIN